MPNAGPLKQITDSSGNVTSEMSDIIKETAREVTIVFPATPKQETS